MKKKINMNETFDKTWEVVGAINGNCVYNKQNLTREESQKFIESVDCARLRNGGIKHFWHDGEGIVASLKHSAFWARPMQNYSLHDTNNERVR